MKMTPYFAPPSLEARYRRLTPTNRDLVRSRAKVRAMDRRSSLDLSPHLYAVLACDFPRAYGRG